MLRPAMKIGIVGGTGKEGRGLALRWARAGHAVTLGSRDAARAAETAARLSAECDVEIRGAERAESVADAELAVLAVPYAAHGETLRAISPVLEGKILLDITVPLAPPKVREVHLPAGKAAALEAQALLGERVRVVAGLHHVSSTELGARGRELSGDVLVCGDDRAAKDLVLSLIGELGARAWDAGCLGNAVALESLTPVLLYLNHRYGGSGAGLRLVGLPAVGV